MANLDETKLQQSNTNTSTEKDNATETNLEKNPIPEPITEPTINQNSILDDNIKQLINIVDTSKLSDENKNKVKEIIDWMKEDVLNPLEDIIKIPYTGKKEELKEIERVVKSLNDWLEAHIRRFGSTKPDFEIPIIQIETLDKNTKEESYRLTYNGYFNIDKFLTISSDNLPLSETTQQSENIIPSPEIEKIMNFEIKNGNL